jgi:hypothetical protein
MTDYTKDLVGLGMPGPLALYMSPLLGANVSSPPGGSSGQIQYNNGGIFGGTNGWTYASSVLTNTQSIGSTPTDGLVLQNTTLAANNAQQNSSSIRLTGQGWSTNSSGASMTTDWIIDSRPVQGATNPAASLQFSAQINKTGYMPVISLGANTAANDGSQINFLGNSIGGTSSGTGFAFALGYNASGNKQIWFGDPDYFGNSGGNFVRITSNAGFSGLDCVSGDNSSHDPLCMSGNGGGIIVGATQANSPSSTGWINGNLAIGSSSSAVSAPTDGLYVKGGVSLGQSAVAVTSAGATISSAADGANNLGHRFSIVINGTTYWVPCGATAF